MASTLAWRAGAEPHDEHPWVLVTGRAAVETTALTERWKAHGIEVYRCEGPGAGHSCPLLDGGTCPVVDHAHLVVNALDPGDRTTDALLDALAVRHPDLPVMDLT